VELAPRVASFAKRHRIVAPILDAVAEGIIASKNPTEELLRRLMTAPMSGHA
jgi:hypothetical protein